MMVSTKGRYALRIMLDIAQHQNEGYVSLKSVSERQAISLKYLEIVIAKLLKAGFVVSQRGKEGGYQLSKEAKDYTVGSILKVMERSMKPVACMACFGEPCELKHECKTLPFWEELDKHVDAYVENVTLQDLLDGKVKKT